MWRRQTLIFATLHNNVKGHYPGSLKDHTYTLSHTNRYETWLNAPHTNCMWCCKHCKITAAQHLFYLVTDMSCNWSDLLFFCLCVLHCAIYLSNFPFSDCWFSVLLFNVYFSHLPYLSKVTITGFPSWEETLINSYNLWGPLSHTLSHSHTHTRTHDQPACIASAFKAWYSTHA